MSEQQHEQDWRPDRVQPPEYPPPEPPTAWQRVQAERKAHRAEAQDDPGDADEHERLVSSDWLNRTGPAGLTDKARAELLRCAEAFESTAKRLREIVGPA